MTLFAISNTFLLVVLFLGHEPREGGEETFSKNLDNAFMGDDEVRMDALCAIGVPRRLQLGLLDVVVWEEGGFGGLLVFLVFSFFFGMWGWGRVG